MLNKFLPASSSRYLGTLLLNNCNIRKKNECAVSLFHRKKNNYSYVLKEPGGLNEHIGLTKFKKI